jgi:hypothetical protein
MAHRLLVVGLVLAAVGAVLVALGPPTVDTLALRVGLATQDTQSRVVAQQTAVPVPSLNFSPYSFTLEEGEAAMGTFVVTGNRTMTFLFLDEPNFRLWEAEQPANYLYASEFVGSLTATVRPLQAGLHYLVFKNDGPAPLTVLFQLSAAREIITPLPLSTIGSPTLIGIGAVVAVLAVRRDRRLAAEMRRLGGLIEERARLARTAQALGIETEGLSLDELRAALRRSLHAP